MPSGLLKAGGYGDQDVAGMGDAAVAQHALDVGLHDGH
jgi:hypothetical protein